MIVDCRKLIELAGDRIIVVGDHPGTIESPSAFGTLVDAALEKGRVSVGLQLPTLVNAVLRRALESDDPEDAMLEGLEPHWSGTGTTAMLDLLASFTRRRGEERIDLFGFVPSNRRVLSRHLGSLQERRVKAMAAAIVAARGDARLLVLSDHFHAARSVTPFGRSSMATLLGSDCFSVSLDHDGGEAFQGGCVVPVEPFRDGSNFDASLSIGVLRPSLPVLTAAA